MTLARFWMLHLLWLLPLVVVLSAFSARRRKRRLERFAEPGLLSRLTGAERKGMRLLKNLLSLGVLGLMILALAGPRWGSQYQEVSRKGVDIALVVDVSASMQVEDITPNRLERARREIFDLLRVVAGDRVALVAFSGVAFIQCPLTLDYGALEMFLGSLQPGLIPVPGTDLNAAIEKGVDTFDMASNTDKVLLLITDGEDNEGRGREAARKAAAAGVKIFVFGMGDPSGGPIPEEAGKGGFKKDAEGNLVLSKLDESGLREIAAATGGTYVRSVAGDLDLDLLYFEGIRRRTRAEELTGGKLLVHEERFWVFVLTAFLFLTLENLLRERRPAAADGGGA